MSPELLCQRREFLTAATMSGLLYLTGEKSEIVPGEYYGKPQRVMQRNNEQLLDNRLRRGIEDIELPPTPKPLDYSPESRRYDKFIKNKYKNYPSLSYGEREKMAKNYGNAMNSLLIDVLSAIGRIVK